MKARDLFRAVENYEATGLVHGLTDDQLRLGVRITAELFKGLKAEAIRRGIWDELKRQRVT